MSRRLFPLVLLVGLLAVFTAGQAQDTTTAKTLRSVYVVQHTPAKELAAILAKHFKGEAEISALPDSPSNWLLISAPPKVFPDVVKLLEQIDRRPQTIAVEVLIAEIPTKKAGDKALDENEFTGSSKSVVEKLDSLRQKGTIASLKRLQLTTLEHQRASVVVGESKPVVMGAQVTARGIVSRNISYRSLGTSLRLSARVADKKSVMLELEVEDSRLHVAPDGTVIGKDEAGGAIIAPEFVNATLKTKVGVAAGQAVAVKGVKTDSKSGQTQTLIVVTARVVEPEVKGDK